MNRIFAGASSNRSPVRLPPSPETITFNPMSALEVIEAIKRLPAAEQQKVAAYLRDLANAGEVSADFKTIAADVFTTNAELFRKLAQ